MSSKSGGDCTKTKKIHILLVNTIPTLFARFEFCRSFTSI